MEAYFSNTGILFAGIIFLIDDLGVPVPSTLLLFSAAIFSAKSPELSPVVLILVSTVYAFLGNFILFLWGQRGARKWLKTHGHKFFLPETRLQRFEEKYVNTHSTPAIFLSSLITNVRPFMSLIVGSVGVPLKKFFPACLLGTFFWALGVVLAGYFLGQHAWEIIWHNWPWGAACVSGLLTGFLLKKSLNTK
ncbi:hypothetical protein CSB37_02405 [bacterium DOLZORAL124_38_8]|nr:MAG: hypothetical protein CSB37_02405 [bacterium DOLZORAL124_38_8]